MSTGRSGKSLLIKVLLICGILSSMLYTFMNIFVAKGYKGYSSFSQTISELSAIDAPTRTLWVSLAIPYTLLVTAFGFGIWLSAHRNRSLHILGIVMIVDGIIGLAWPPMHLREVLAAGGKTMTDTMHLVFASVTVLLMLLAIGLGAAAFGNWFRLYSIITLILLSVFGALTGAGAPRVEANLPTPWIGVWERINIGLFLLWVIVLAVILLRKQMMRAPIPLRVVS